MPLPETPNIDADLALLAARFITRLAERQARLHNAWDTWQRSGSSAVPAALISELHALAGAAPLFGHQVLGAQARTLEQALLRAGVRREAVAPDIAALFAGIAAVQAGEDPPV